MFFIVSHFLNAYYVTTNDVGVRDTVLNNTNEVFALVSRRRRQPIVKSITAHGRNRWVGSTADLSSKRDRAGRKCG